MSGLYFLSDLIQVQLAEGIDPSADQDNVFVPFDSIHPVKRVIQRIEQVGFREAGHPQTIQSSHDRIFVLREIHQDLWLHVVINGCNPVIFLQRAGKDI